MKLTARVYDFLFWSLVGAALSAAFLVGCAPLQRAIEAAFTPSPATGKTPANDVADGLWGLLLSKATDPAAWAQLIGGVTVIGAALWGTKKVAPTALSAAKTATVGVFAKILAALKFWK